MTMLVSKLRPAKVRNAVRRRWFKARVPRLHYAQVPALLSLGSSYGGWLLPDGLIKPGWVCYCIGAGGDVSFDIELLRRYDAIVRSIDPVEEYVARAIEDAGSYPRFSAYRAAIATVDGPIRMQVTHDCASHSVSPAGLYESKNFIELPGRTLRSLMAELGDQSIDLLKIDIEGGEYELLPTLDLNALGVKLFAVQLHHTGTVHEARSLIAALGQAGYEPVACRSSVKVAFAHSDVLRGLDESRGADAESPAITASGPALAPRRWRARSEQRRIPFRH
jgi:FkbM family methyltransferase